MRNQFMRQLVVVAITLLVVSASAWADITGSVYRLNGNCNNVLGCGGVADATSAVILAGTPLGSFTAPGVDFFVAGPQGTSNPLSEFLNSGGATGITVGATELGQVMSNCPGQDPGGAGCYSTGIVINGSGTFLSSTQYSLYHDDGATMFIDGGTQVVNKPHPQEVGSPDTFFGTGIGGAYQIYYVATNGNPERLQLDPSPVPDGGVTLMLFGGALFGLETLRRKFRA